MTNYRKLKKDGTPVGKYSSGASKKPMEGANRYVQDTPTFESTVTKGGQGTRGDKTFSIGAKEYERTKEKKQESKPAKKNPEGAVSGKAASEFRRQMKEEEMLRKMGKRYDEIMPDPEYAVGGSVMSPKQQKKVSTVMKEFKAGSLHSGKGGKVVKNPKQAIAISLSEARRLKK